MGVKTVLPVLTLLCVIGAVWCNSYCVHWGMPESCAHHFQEKEDVCSKEACSEEECVQNGDLDKDDNIQNECCRYFRDSCCSEDENTYLTLLFRLTLGLSIGIFGLLVIISVIIVCCCCCICCG